MDAYPSGNLRVSDAERDQALSGLSEHFQAGRLTMEEFQERSDKALRAKTRSDLAELFTDLPGSKGPADSGNPSGSTGRPLPPRTTTPVPAADRPLAERHGSLVPLVVVAVVFTVAAVVAALSQHHVILVAPVIIWLMVFRRLARSWGGYDHRKVR